MYPEINEYYVKIINKSYWLKILFERKGSYENE